MLRTTERVSRLMQHGRSPAHQRTINGPLTVHSRPAIALEGPDPVRALQKLVCERMEELGESARTAAGRSRGLVSNSTISRIMTGGSTGRLKDDTIAGLALALKLPEDKIREAAELDATPARWAEMTSDVLALSPEHFDQAMDLLDGFLEELRRRERRKR